jgi:hypothetical protein
MLDMASRASTSHEICLDLSEYIQTRIPDHLENDAANEKRKRRRGKGQAGSTADVEVIVDV